MRSRGDPDKRDKASETESCIAAAGNNRTICSSGDRWSGIIQQHEEIVSGVFDTEKGRWKKDGILPSECGVCQHRKESACDIRAGNAEAAGWWGKG